MVVLEEALDLGINFFPLHSVPKIFSLAILPHQLGNDEVIRKHVQRKIIEQLCAESLMLNLLIIDSGKYILELLLNTK